MEALRDLVANVLDGLAAGRVPTGTTDHLVRARAAHHRAANTALRSLYHPPAVDDVGTLDTEETVPALRRQLLEARTAAEGFVEAVALLVSPKFAAAVDSAAQELAAAEGQRDGRR